MKIVLASRSPRRRQLLEMIGVPHAVVPSDLPEDALHGEPPQSQVLRLAEGKAASVSARLSGDRLVIGADTLVVVDGDVLGQPRDNEEAFLMLRRLAGRSHTVYTGLCLIRPGLPPARGLSESLVTFHPMSDEEARWYVETREPLDKAGAYAAQGIGAVFLKRIEGSFHNVVGFPLDLFCALLPRLDLSLQEIILPAPR